MTPRTRHNIKNGFYLALFIGSVAGFTFWFMTLAAKAAEPYSLEQDGLHMVSPLKDGDHLNVRRDDDMTVNVHIEAKCADRTDAECAGKPGLDARWLGATFVPWSAFGVSADSCAVWIQHSGANWHYGEHGEPAYCPGKPKPEPTPTPEPSPTVTPEPEPTPEPVPPVTPEPSPEPTPTPSACSLTGEGCGTVPEKAEDALEPSPEPTFAASSEGPIYVTDDTPTDSTPVLAATGADTSTPLMIAAALALVGAGVAIVRRAVK